MALTSITKDFVVKAGALIEGTSIVTSSTGQTGTLQVNGGVAIAKNLVVGTTATVWGDTSLLGQLTVTGYSTLGLLTATSFTATSANIIGNAQVGGLFTATGATELLSTLKVTGNSLFNGAVNTFSGALFVTGTNILTVGTGATNLGGTLTVAGVTAVTNTTTANYAGGTAAFTVAGGAIVDDNLYVKSTAVSTATSTGNAIYTPGGMYAGAGLTVNGPALFKDAVTFAGSATYVLSTNTYYTDNLLELHVPPSGVYGTWGVDDGKDIGLRFHYYQGGNRDAALVLANDTKYLEWYGSGAEDSTGTFSTAIYGTFKTGQVILTSSTAATSTVTGALQVAGGIGIGGAVYGGSSISGNTIVGRNLTTASGIVYSMSDGTLQNTPVTFNATTQRLVGRIDYANTSTSLEGGTAGSLPYQTNPNTTAFLPIGNNGEILIVSGGNPTWTVPVGLTAGSATTASNIAGGLKDQIPYQSNAGQTVFNAGLRFNGTTFTATNIVASNTANATGYNNNTGALQVRGGAAINNDLWVGGDINLNGNLYLQGIGLNQLTGTTGTFDYVIVEGTGTGLTVTDSATIGGTLRVTGYSQLGLLTATTFTATSANIIGNETVGGNLTVTGYSTFGLVTATIFTATTSRIIGNETVGGTLGVTGYTTLSLLRATVTTVTNLTVTGNEDVTGTLTVTGYSTLGLLRATDTTVTNLTVTGNESVTGTLAVTGYSQLGLLRATVTTVTNLSVTGNEDITGTLTVTGYSTFGLLTATTFTATSANIIGNETVGGTLGVTGLTTLGLLTATITTVTALTVIGNETVGGTLNVTGRTTIGDMVTGVNGTITATNLVVTTNATLPSSVTITSLTATNLSVTGNGTFGGNLQVTGLFTATGTTQLGTTNISGITSITNATDSNAINAGALVVSGGVGIAKSVVVGEDVTIGSVSTQTVVAALYHNNTLLSSYTSGFITSNSQISLDTFSSTAYRTAKYLVQIVDVTKVHVQELLLFHDGTNVYTTEYAVATNTGELGSFDATLAGSTVTLKFTANYTPTNMTIKVTRTTITI